jgi:glycosyltransferase involved in cell wall biosynthesis/tetratricopeptide (TPR) repeat protein
VKKGQPSQAPQATKAPVQEVKDILLSLVIPCYNESKRIDLMLSGLAEFDEKWKGKYEVIVVDDGSKDDTAEKVKEAINSKYDFLRDKITIEKMPANGGKGSALKKGVSLANGDFVLTLDADMSTRPTELLNWLKRDKDLLSGNDTISIGSRKHKEGKIEALQSRKLIGGVFNGIVQIFTTLRLKDTQCGFKLYPRDAAMFLFDNMQSKGWAHDVELLYQADLNDIHIVEMPISWVNQPESKVNVVKDSMMMFFGVLSISFRIWFYNSFILPFRIPASATAEQKKHIIYRSIFNILAILLVIVMPMMSFQYAVTGDEHWHFDYGNSIYNYFFHGDKSAQTATSGIQYYGGIFDFITAYVYNVFHIWDHYTTMHFVNALVGAIGIIYAGKLAKLLGGWNTGILAMILLILSPSWFGHNFANPKDIPFSVGYTAGIYYILLFLQALPNTSLKHLLGLVCSIGWAMGVRIGGLLLIVYLVMFIGIYGLFTRQLKTIINLRLVKQIAIVAISGYLIALICWPWAHLDLIGKPLEALKVMSNFFINIGLLYDGQKIFSNQVPWFYIPKYILYTAPIIVLVGTVIGLLSIPVLSRKKKNFLLFTGFLIFTCVFPVAYAIYKKSSLYDGWRHFLFVYPPLVIIASIGWTALINMKQKAIGIAVILIIAAGLIPPARFALAWHPYESLYYNEIAGGLKGMYGKYETDYYMLGIKDATAWLMTNEHLENKKAVIGTNCTYPLLAELYQGRYKKLPFKYDRIYEQYADFHKDAEYEKYAAQYPDFKDTFGVYPSYASVYQRYYKDWDYYIMFSRFIDASQLTTGNWPPPDVMHTIVVDGVPIAAILKRKTHKDFEGFQLMKAQKVAEAKEKFLESLQEYPENELVWETLADIYEREGKADSAMYAGNIVLKRHPSNINMYQLMGNIYMKQGKADSAVKLYKRLEQYSPGYSHFLLAYSYATTGNAKAALTEIDNAIEADPHLDQAYKLGIQIAHQTKNSAKEEEYYEKAKKEFPEEEK